MSKAQLIAPGFESDGEFEFAGKKPNDIIRLYGKLVIGKNGLITVTFMEINQAPQISAPQKISLVRGLIDKHTTEKIHVSLFNCDFMIQSLSFSTTAQHKYRLITTSAFFSSGSHFDSNDVSVIGFATDKLHNWLWSAKEDTQQVRLLGKSGRELKRDNLKKIRYFKIPIMYLNKNYDINLGAEKIKISLHTALRTRPFYNTSSELVVPSDSSVRIQFPHKKNIGDAREIVFRLNQLLSLLSFKFHSINRLFTEYPVRYKTGRKIIKYDSEADIIDYGIIASRIDRPQTLSHYFQAFKFVERDLQNIIERWFASYDLLESVINTLIPRHDPEVIQSHTMVFYTELIKAIEVFGRKKYKTSTGNGCTTDPLQYVIKQCINRIEDIFTVQLIQNLGITNSNINKKANVLGTTLGNIRNVVAHYNLDQLSKVPSWLITNGTLNPINVHQLNTKLKLLLLYLLCCELGFETKFDPNNIKWIDELTDN